METQRRTFLRRIVSDLISIYCAIKDAHSCGNTDLVFYSNSIYLLQKYLAGVTIRDRFKAARTVTYEDGRNEFINDSRYFEATYRGINVFEVFDDARKKIRIRGDDCIQFLKFMDCLKILLTEKIFKYFSIVETHKVKAVLHEKHNVIFYYRNCIVNPTSDVRALGSLNLAKDTFSVQNIKRRRAIYLRLTLETYDKDDMGRDTVNDFMYAAWGNFIDFVYSAFANFHIEYDGFSNIKLCKECNKMHLPQRSGKERGVFCSQKCQKQYFDKNNKTISRCIANQRRRFYTVTSRTNDAPDINDVFPENSFPHTEKCRECKILTDATIKAGQCPILQNNKQFMELVEIYKNNPVKRKIVRKVIKK